MKGFDEGYEHLNIFLRKYKAAGASSAQLAFLAAGYKQAWRAASTATLKELLEALPSDETIMKESYGYGHEGSKLFELGVNWLTKEIRAIIEKKLESV